MKNNAIIRIVIFSFVILLLVGVLLTGIGINMFTFVPVVDKEYTTGSSGEIEATVQNLEIEWASGNVSIETADVDKISFHEDISGSGMEKMVYAVEGNTLKIQYCQSGISLNLFNFSSKNLTVTVPKNWQCSEMKIEAASATVTFSNIQAANVELEIASGNSNFKDCNIDHLEVDTASGDVNYTGTLTTLDCDAASADVTAYLENTPARICMDSASGDLDLTLPADSGFTATMESISGKLVSDFETIYDGKNYVHGDGACQIELDCASGNIQIHKAQ